MDQEATYQPGVVVAADASEDARSAFIRKTYIHLAGALAAFALLLTVLYKTPATHAMAWGMVSSGMAWIGVLVAFMVVGWIANWFAHSAESAAMQYVGLGLYVVAEAVIFLPLILIATRFSNPTVISSAAVITGAMFAGLTAIVFITRKDFSFLRSGLILFALVALGVIVAGLMWGFHLGLVFSGLMILLASGFILYETSNVLHHYPTDRHVGASLALFASVALLLWYVILFLMEFAGD